jgi:hypothetical protein
MNIELSGDRRDGRVVQLNTAARRIARKRGGRVRRPAC